MKGNKIICEKLSKLKIVNKVKEVKEKKVEQIKTAQDEVKNVTLVSLFEGVVDTILSSLKFSLNDIIIIPGRPLREPLMFSGLVLLLSLGCAAFDVPFLVDWKGALLGTGILLLIVIINERRGL